ncbi:MAG: CapA family protein, partial [Patescibacteria group bacterium]
MYRPIYFLYFLVFLVIGWEGYSFCSTFNQVYETTLEGSVTRNLALSQVINAVAASQTVEKEVKVMFVGDVMISRAVGDKIEKAKNPNYPFILVASTTQSMDILFANLETPISTRGKNQGSIYSFRADPKVVNGLVFAGFDVVSLANNHIWDWGKDALSDTVEILQKNNIATVGAGKNLEEAEKPAVIKKKGTTFAFLGYTNLLPKS